MSYSDLLAKTLEFAKTAQLMGALGAELRLRQMGQDGDPQVRAAMHAVLEKFEPGSLDDLEPYQVAAIIGRLTTAFQDGLEFMNAPDQTSGWNFTDPAILQERGRGSRSIARNFANLARERPEMEDALANGDFLDIGTGVGWLAIEAARLWPDMRIVGIDIWEPSLKLAETNISEEGLQDRITLRRQSASDIDDQSAFDVIWLPGPFLPKDVFITALPRVHLALRPEGFLIIAGISNASDALSQSLTDLQIIRSGGYPWRVDELTGQLRVAGFSEIEHIESGAANSSQIMVRRPAS